MKKLYTIILAAAFAVSLSTFACADVAGMGYIIAGTLIVPVLVGAVIIVAIAILAKAIKKSGKRK